MKIVIYGNLKKGNHKYYKCICPYCHRHFEIRSDHFKNRKKDNCGCLNHNDAKNDKRHKLYNIHQAMKQRCLNPNQKFYYRYGGREIKICKEWLEYKKFKKWSLENGYKENCDLDRIDNNGHYEPSNCRWVKHKDNCNNKENTIKVEIDNIIYTITDLAKKYNLPRNLISNRYTRGKRGIELVEPRKYIKNNNTV